MAKHADLSPPLGFPGGPCHVVDRIEEEVKSPRLRDELSEKVERGESLSNPEARKVYDVESERGGGLFKKMDLTGHVQYRMDQRSVTVTEIRLSLANFSNEFLRGKELQNQNVRKNNLIKLQSQFRVWEAAVKRGAEIVYQDPSFGLTLVFEARGSTARIITTYWTGQSDPRPGKCYTKRAFRPNVEDWGTQTFTRPPQTEERPPILPLRDDHSKEQRREVTKFELNSPGSGSNLETTVTPGSHMTPGEQYGHPYKTRVDQRRVDAGLHVEVDSLAGGQGGYPSEYNPVLPREDFNDNPPGDARIHGPYWNQREDQGGSSRVIPPKFNSGKTSIDSEDFINHDYENPWSYRKEIMAAKIVDVLTGLSDKVQDRATDIQPSLKRVNQKNAIWTFEVPSESGQGTYEVKIKAIRKGRTQDLSKLDIKLKCSCNFWRWQGPEYHAKREDYLLGKPRGTASTPDIRDVPRHHRACKHVVAVLDMASDYFIRPWEGRGKKASIRVAMSKIVAERWLQSNS